MRVYSVLRTADLERFRHMTPARVLYRHPSYDFDESLIDPDSPPVRLARRGVIRELLRGRYDVVETNEPGMGGNLPFLLAQLAAIRVRAVISRRQVTVATYCIQNIDPALEVARKFHLPWRLARFVTGVAMRAAVRWTDRLAFGTKAALELYGSYVGGERLQGSSRLIEELPTACDCLGGSADPRTPTQLAFVGALAERKGIRQAMAAWDLVRHRVPAARFHIIGTGPLEGEVTAWAADRPEVTLEIDPPRPVIHRTLRRSGALILLSQPTAVWREQIGFPITEGLSHGCEIITSADTGLADWLAQHGHGVVPPNAPAVEVAGEVEASFGRAAQRCGSLNVLPTEDQRIAADRWLMTGSTS